MSTSFHTLVAFFLFASPAIGQMESLQIEGPRKVGLGQLVRLSANTVENETPLWIVLDPIDLDHEVIDNGKRLLFSSGCQRTSVTVILLAQQVKGGRIITRQIRRSIAVSEEQTDTPIDSPTVPKQPDPLPKPPPTELPIFGLILDAWPNIRTDAGKSLSLSVAKNFESVASKCESNQFDSAEEIWRELSSQNQRTLQIETTAWEPVAFALQESFKQLRPNDVPAHAIHLRAAAAAIREAFAKSKQTKQGGFRDQPNRRLNR